MTQNVVLGAGLAHDRLEPRRPVRRARDLVRGAASYVTRPAGRPQTSRTCGSRSMRLVAWGRSSPCIVNAAMRSRIGESSISRVCISPGGRWIASMIGCAGAAVLDDAAAEVREARRRVAAAARRSSGTIGSSMQVGDRPAAVRVQPEREDAEHERLEVVHEVAADDVGVADPGAQQQARRLERAAARRRRARRVTSCASPSASR